MAKLINSLPVFQRREIGPDYLNRFPSLWTSVSKVLCPSHYRARPWPKFFCWAEDIGGVSTAVAVSQSPQKGRAGAQLLPIVT